MCRCPPSVQQSARRSWLKRMVEGGAGVLARTQARVVWGHQIVGWGIERYQHRYRRIVPELFIHFRAKGDSLRP